MMQSIVAGVDEVGRGPLIGDVVAAAVILDPANPIEGLNDSKKLSEKKRLELSQLIKKHALDYAFGRATPAEIDELNILHASMLAMQRAVLALKIEPTLVKIDGNKCPELPYPAEAVIGGDKLIAQISAASIIAKVKRDSEMIKLDKLYPQYGLKNHKGYPTKAHLAAIQQHGVNELYRKSFAPVKRILQSTKLEHQIHE